MVHPAHIACNSEKSVDELIEMSVSGNCTVHAPYRATFHDDLLIASDGNVEGKEVIEFWGDADDTEGRPAWRIHLHKKTSSGS